MPTEYQSLFMLTVFMALAWLPASLAKTQAYGLNWLAGNRDSAVKGELCLWGCRAERAYSNLKDYFPAFAVTILLLGILNGFNDVTSAAAFAFLLGRLVHFPAYCLGWAKVRSLSFFVSLGAQLVLFSQFCKVL